MFSILPRPTNFLIQMVVAIGWIIGLPAESVLGQSPGADSPGRISGPTKIERVLVIDEEGTTRPAFVQLMEGFREGLSEAPDVRFDVFIENLDLIRLERGSHDVERATDWLLQKYSGMSFEVIVTTSRLTRDFVVQNRDRLSPGARIVSFDRRGERSDSPEIPTNSTGVSVASPLVPTLETAHKLFPNAKRVMLIGQRQPHPMAMQGAEAMIHQAANELNLEFVPLIDLPLNELRDRLRTAPVDSIVYYYGYWKDEFGRAYVPAELLSQLSAETLAPVFGAIETYIGRGVVGGTCADLRAIGLALGRQIVAGRNGFSPAPITVPLFNLFDGRVLDRFGISPDQLPEGSRVLFQQPRLWDRYWHYLLGGFAVVGTQTGLIVALVSQLRRRRRAEQIVAEQRELLTHAGRVSTLGQFAAALAHELGQPLGAILNNLEVVEQLLRKDDSVLGGELREIVADIVADERRAGAVLDRIRALVRKQRFTTGAVEVTGLIRSVLALAAPRLDNDGIVVSVHCEPSLPPLAGDEILLQQLLLNLIANSADAIRTNHKIAHHDGYGTPGMRREPGAIVIRARRDADKVELAVVDSGGGVAESVVGEILEPFVSTKQEGLGVGLSIVRSIVEQHEGELQVENNPGQGLTVRLRLPVWKQG